MVVMKQKTLYWLCQLGGWLGYSILYIVFYLSFRTKSLPHFYEMVLVEASLGLLTTHCMRIVIIQKGFLQHSLKKQLLILPLLTIAATFIWAIMAVSIERLLQLEPLKAKKYPFFNRVLFVSLGMFLYIFIWNLLYFAYHYILQSQKSALDRIQLEKLVKELELRTIKTHINPHFIFNSLNSIRALIDENPERARIAITELSNILRSSMHIQTEDITPLEKELSIVKDYLALEYMRFEDRLKIEYCIDEKTLQQPIPPMMLQTLVENAIKHGISKQVNGGTIKISSELKENCYQLTVQNTGQLNGYLNKKEQGFGLESTTSRLKLLFGDKAHFEIKDLPNHTTVEAKLILPVGNLL